jgi:radical SAM family uncharacterized protein/radical SAM-linked protein
MTISNENLRDVLLNEILPNVERPSRYLGTELNAIHKNPEEVELRIALAFPDLYDLGLGNLGLLILYEILNRLPWCWAERAYAPAPDMEDALRQRGLGLFAYESKDPLSRMDGIAITLQSELTYTNVLNIIDMAGAPLRAADRDDEHPLFFAGGPCAVNPEPLAPFLDFFLIGDGEEAVVEIAEVMRATKGLPRRERLEALAAVEGVYVPALYPSETLDDGRIVPKEDAPKILRRVVSDLDATVFPTRFIVPFTQLVHDRAGLEVMRGCTHGCRFCQAGMIGRPVRERSLDKAEELIDGMLTDTGYEELSLVSLSTCDYSRVSALVGMAAKRGREDNVSVSLPSLRLDTFSVALANKVTGVRRSGLTFAPEAATARLRAVINKWIPDEVLLETAEEAYRLGWGHVKTYFMIGLPTERDEDVEAIADLCLRTLERGRAVSNRVRVNTGVSTFVPKPFTPFQWAEQIGLDEAKRRQAILEWRFAKEGGIKFGRHDPAATLVEGMISRGDRRTGDLIEAAWRKGARFESWDERLNLRVWLEAAEEAGLDVDHALRARDLDERLPWDHIDMRVSKEWLREDWQRAMDLEHYEDCRLGTCQECGVNQSEGPLCLDMREKSIAGAAEEADIEPVAQEEREEPPAVQRLRFRIGRSGEARFLSNLELMSAWARALRRARAPLSYSQGFHAHPKITFSSAPPLGEESEGDYMDVILFEHVEPETMIEGLVSMLPMGLRVFDVADVPLKTLALMAATTGYSYTLFTDSDAAALRERIEAALAAETILVERKAKKKFKGKGKGRGQGGPATMSVDVRPMITAITLEETPEGASAVQLELGVVDGRGIRIREITPLLGLDPARTGVLKRATHLQELPAP